MTILKQKLPKWSTLHNVLTLTMKNGERSIPLEVLGRLVDLYNVSVDYIMDRETK